MDTKTFIQKAKEIHGDKYDYSEAEYKSRNKDKIKIICPKHGEFWQTPGNHLAGKGCIKCAQRYHPSTEEFIEQAKEIHGDKYDYSKVNYINAKTKVCIICPEHGEFWQTPYTHIKRNFGCPKCGINKKYTEDSESVLLFVQRAKKIHGDRYNYSKSSFIKKGKRIFINIICPEHGEFTQRVDLHLAGKGCPKCNRSKGEAYTRLLLEKEKIKFETEKTFKDLLGYNGGSLRFDFWLPEHNAVIEYNGRQHYKADKFFGGEEKFKEAEYNDLQKKKWCEKNNISLFIIDKCAHSMFCSKDRYLIEETIKKIISENN